MKKWICVWIVSALGVVVCTAAVLFLNGWLCVSAIAAVLALWAVFLVRFGLLKYRISDSFITVSGGLFFKYSRTIKRSAILSQSGLYMGKQLICTVIRTAGNTEVLFCSLSEDKAF